MRRNIRTFILIISALSGVAAFQSPAFGIGYVLDEQDSYSQLWIQSTVSAGPVWDTNSTTCSGLFFTKSVACSANSPNSGAYAQQRVGFRCIFSPDEDDPTWETLPPGWPVDMDMSVKIALDGEGYAHGDWWTDSSAEDHYDAAQLFCDLLAHSTLCWVLRPNKPNEYEGMPIKVLVWANYSLSTASSNCGSPGRSFITNLNINDGVIGPLYSYAQDGWGNFYFNRWLGPNPLESETFVMPLGEVLKIQYEYEFHARAPQYSGNDSYWEHPLDPTDLYVCARAEPYQLLMKFDKGYLRRNDLLDELQNRESLDASEEEVAKHAIVDGACADGVTQLVLGIELDDDIFQPYAPPADTENPQRIRLSILSPDGKDNGYLISEGQDDCQEGYADTPRIADGLFTQTWCAPGAFDSVLGSANKMQTREIPVQIEVDCDDDGDYDYTFIEYIILKRPKLFMITFDDGPVPGNTENIVNALKNIYVGCEPVKAGFFMVGDDPGFPEELGYYSAFEFWLAKGSVKKNHPIVQEIAAYHLVGNHTQHHACFNIWWAGSPLWWVIYGSTKNYVIDEIEQCNKEIRDAIDNTPMKLFRAPYFVDNPGVRAACSKEELDYQIIMGAGDNLGEASGDTRGLPICPPSLEYVKNNAASLIRRWDRDYPCVLTFHDISPTTANNIENIIESLQKEFTLVHFDPNRLPDTIPSPLHHETNTIHQSETVTHIVSLDSTVSTATFNVSWEGSDLDLVLYKPDGTRIDSNSASADPNIKYAERDTYEYYTVSDPNPGAWVMEVLGVNVPADGEEYTIRVEADSDLTLFGFTDKPEYGLSEDINVSAELAKDANSVTGALVMAKVQRPDGSVDNLTLYDDGAHGDKDRNDGFYANVYNNTSLRGSYEIAVSAIGELTGEQYERSSSLTAMVGSIIYGNVNFGSYAVFADRWLAQNCAEPDWCDTADLDQSGQVDLFDLGALAEYWLEGATP